MGHAIAIKSTNETATIIESLWDASSKLEEQPSMRALNYPPHISLGIYEGIMKEKLISAVDAVSAEFEAFSITFEELATFEAGEKIVLWAKPKQENDLRRLHEKIHSLIDPKLCHSHYLPENWVTHCTLATDIPCREKSKVDAFIKEYNSSFNVLFDAIDCVSFFPVEVMHEIKLQDTL